MNQEGKRNIAHMWERYQASDRAGTTIANSALQDAEIITLSDKLFVIDKNESEGKRNKYQHEIRAEEDRFLKWSVAYTVC